MQKTQRTLFFYTTKKDDPSAVPRSDSRTRRERSIPASVDDSHTEPNNPRSLSAALGNDIKAIHKSSNAVPKRSRSPSPSLSSSQSEFLDKRRCQGKISPTETDRVVREVRFSSRWLADLILDVDWKRFLTPILQDNWRDRQFYRIELFLDAERSAGKLILPPHEWIFSAFNNTALHSLKVVLLGQDPYHNIGQAHGMCFSVLPGVRPPPSLQNIYKELANDIPGFTIPSHGYLDSWAKQGMLLLNATLTVEAHKPNSHSQCGWQLFTNEVIQLLSRKCPNRLVFLLWGNFARAKKGLIDLSRHVVIECAHPSPLSARQWFGCRCFSKCNATLKELGHSPMSWQLPLELPSKTLSL